MIKIKDLENYIIQLKNLNHNLKTIPENINIYKKEKLNLENKIRKYEIILEKIKNCNSFKKIIENKNYDNIIISLQMERSIIFYKNNEVTETITINKELFNEEIVSLIRELKIEI